MSQQIDLVVSQAREGKFNLIEFRNALDRLGIHYTQRMLYVRDVFGFALEQAKNLVLEADGGSVEAWTKEESQIGNRLEILYRYMGDEKEIIHIGNLSHPNS